MAPTRFIIFFQTGILSNLEKGDFRVKPFGLFTSPGSPELSGEDVSQVSKMVEQAENLAGIGGLEAIRLVRDLPGGGQAVLISHGGVCRVIVARTEEPPLSPTDPAAEESQPSLGVPNFVSGRMVNPTVPHGRFPTIELTEQSRKRLVGYSADTPLPPKRLPMERFLVSASHRFPEFQGMGHMFRTQYQGLRPSWYSGAMGEVVQILCGYGKQPAEGGAGNGAGPLPPGTFHRARAQVISGGPLPGYTGEVLRGGQIQYDYKHAQCHAISFGSDGRPWLLQIDRRGAWAMPLPMVPVTTTQAYREWVVEKGDSEILWVLDRFGGLPSGEPFPTGKRLEAWKRAGVVLKICDTADYYDNYAYSSASGWSFNSRGSEGYNTCFNRVEGLLWGYTYAMVVQIGPTIPRPRWDLEHLEGGERESLNRYLSGLYRLLDDDVENRQAVRYKLAATPIPELLKFPGGNSPEAAYNYWVNSTVPDLAQVGGSCRRVGSGRLYSSRFQGGPQFKVPEPMLGACLSVDFRSGGDPVKCDTVIWAYFIGDDLITVKFFRDDRQANKPDEDGFDECMVVGSWEKTEYLGFVGTKGNFYTSDVDEREEFSDRIRHTRVKGLPLGAPTIPAWGFTPLSRYGSLTRNKYFSKQTNVRLTEGRGKDLGLAVPFFTRSAVVTAVTNSISGSSSTETMERVALADPYSYGMWTYDEAFHWSGGITNFPENSRPYPRDGYPVWVEVEYFDEGRCSEWADTGPWIPSLPQDYSWLVHPFPNYHPFIMGAQGVPRIREYEVGSGTDGERVSGITLSMLPDTVKMGNLPVADYYRASPDMDNKLFYRDACQNCAGSAVYASLSEPYPKRTHWGYTSLADHSDAHIFIGVINE